MIRRGGSSVGFYIRKSFKAGPFRLNLSKSGLGVSAGVKGARIGVDAKGRAYTHAGRYGLYHRQYHSGFSGSSRTREEPTTYPLIDEEIHMPTGVTFSSRRDVLPQSTKTSPEAYIVEPKHPVAGVFSAALAILAVTAAFAETLSPWFTALVSLVGVGSAILGVRNLVVIQGRKRLQNSVAAILRSGSSFSMENEIETDGIPAEDVAFVGKTAFRDLLVDIVRDGRVDADERERMAWCEDTFSLEQAFVLACKVAAFQRVVLVAVSDHDLTREEEATLAHVRSEFDLPDHAIAELRATVSELSEVRRIREGELRPIDTTHKLGKTEACYFEAPARLLKYNVLKRFTRDGVRHKVRGYEIAKEGVLLLTSRRITLRHEGASNIPYTKVLNVEVDADQNLITIVKDGVQKPVYITTPRSLEASAMIAELAGL